MLILITYFNIISLSLISYYKYPQYMHQQPDQQINLLHQLFHSEKYSLVDPDLPQQPQQPEHSSLPQKLQASVITTHLYSILKQHQQQPWRALAHIPQYITQIYNKLVNIPEVAQVQYFRYSEHMHQHGITIGSNVTIDNPHCVYIGRGTTIAPGVSITGPCLIGRNCELRQGALLRGNVVLGDKSLVGNSCEIKNSLLMDGSQIAHFNYIGDSILGVRTHFGAGAITSNYKLDASQIRVTYGRQKGIPTGRDKLGAILGHDVEIGCNSVLNPGSIVGRGSMLYPLTSLRGFLGAGKIVKTVQQHQVIVKRQQ